MRQFFGLVSVVELSAAPDVWWTKSHYHSNLLREIRLIRFNCSAVEPLILQCVSLAASRAMRWRWPQPRVLHGYVRLVRFTYWFSMVLSCSSQKSSKSEWSEWVLEPCEGMKHQFHSNKCKISALFLHRGRSTTQLVHPDDFVWGTSGLCGRRPF